MLDLTNKTILYILGFMWADGNLNYNTLSTEIKYSDYEQLKNIVDTTELNWKFSNRYRTLKKTGKSYHQGSMYLTDKEISKQLYDYDFKIKSYVSPIKLLNDIPEYLHHHFIRGYIDGDGSFSIYKVKKNGNFGSVKFNITSTINYDWNFIINIFNNININSYLVNNYNRKSGKSSIIGLHTKWDIIKFGEWLYKDCENIKFERKYNKFLEIKNCDIKKKVNIKTYDNINFIKENYKIIGNKKCAEYLNISVSSVDKIAINEKILFRIKKQIQNKKWTEDDKKFLLEKYNILGGEKCSEYLNKSLGSIRTKYCILTQNKKTKYT